ncbi:hypothetical protein ACFVWT_18775 [Arthrobacter sp. NPDC058288]
MKAYPTVHNKHDRYALPAYEIRGQELYPTVHNKRDSYALPAYEIRC